MSGDHNHDAHHHPYGLLAEFDQPQALLDACTKAYGAGYRLMDAYTPYPIEAIAEAIGFHKNMVAPAVLAGGILGGLGGFALQYWVATTAYPLNIGGRPLNTWPSWVPVTFECTILLAALTAVIGMMLMNRLPQPYHPVFNVPRFERATQDAFFLCIESADPKFDLAATRAFLQSLGPREVSDVAY